MVDRSIQENANNGRRAQSLISAYVRIDRGASHCEVMSDLRLSNRDVEPP